MEVTKVLHAKKDHVSKDSHLEKADREREEIKGGPTWTRPQTQSMQPLSWTTLSVP